MLNWIFNLISISKAFALIQSCLKSICRNILELATLIFRWQSMRKKKSAIIFKYAQCSSIKNPWWRKFDIENLMEEINWHRLEFTLKNLILTAHEDAQLPRNHCTLSRIFRSSFNKWLLENHNKILCFSLTWRALLFVDVSNARISEKYVTAKWQRQLNRYSEGRIKTKITSEYWWGIARL